MKLYIFWQSGYSWITKYIALSWGYKHRFSAGFHQSWVTQYRQILQLKFAFQMKFWPGRHGAWRCGWGWFLAVFRVVVYCSFDRSPSKNPVFSMLFKIFERDSQPSFSHGPCGVLLVMVADMKSSKKGEIQQISCFQGECNVSLPDSDTRWSLWGKIIIIIFQIQERKEGKVRDYTLDFLAAWVL